MKPERPIKINLDKIDPKNSTEFILPPVMHRSVVLQPAHRNAYNEDGSLNGQFRVKGPGVHYDAKTGRAIMLFTGASLNIDDPEERINNVDQMRRNPCLYNVYGVYTDDNWKTVTHFDATSQALEDRTKALPIFTSSDKEGCLSLNGQDDPRVTSIEWFGTKAFFVLVTTFNKADYVETNRRIGFDRTKPTTGFRPELYYSTDLLDPSSYKPLGFIGPEEDYIKNVVIHPELITVDGVKSVAIFTRKLPNIQMLTIPLSDFPRLSTDPEFRKSFWSERLKQEEIERSTILRPMFEWEGVGSPSYPAGQIATGAPPFKIEYSDPQTGEQKKAWMLVYNAVPNLKEQTAEGRFVGAALLDYDDPTKVISRSPIPIIQPVTSCEATGRRPQVTFATSAYIDSEKNLRIFYSGGDEEISMACCKSEYMMEYLLQFDQNGKLKSSQKNNSAA